MALAVIVVPTPTTVPEGYDETGGRSAGYTCS